MNDTTGEDTYTPEVIAAPGGRQEQPFQRMTMDGMEVMGSQPHAGATSPFLLSSPPLGHHHHHHHHATFNLQTVQLSFDACLTYNAVSSAAGGTSSSLSSNASSLSGKAAVPTLCLSSCTPLHQQHQVAPSPSPDLQQAHHRDHPNHHNHHNHDHHHPHHHRQDDHRLHPDVDTPASPRDPCNDKRHQQRLEDERECIADCRDSIQDQSEKDKAGDLNTPVTTSSDLPSFFGPSALVEPPPITGTSFLLKTHISNENLGFFSRFYLLD